MRRGAWLLCALSTIAGVMPAMAADEAQIKRGRLLFLQCRACHDTQPSDVLKVGPNLHGVVGRRAANEPTFKTFSVALKESKLTWTPETLDRWIANPGALVPGTTMALAGIANPADRAAIVAFLANESQGAAKP